MRNRKNYLLITCILVVALIASLVIGCAPKDNNGPEVTSPEENGGNQFGDSSKADIFAGAFEVKNADKFIQFDLFASLKSDEVIDEKVKVQDAKGNVLDVAIVSFGDKAYRVYAPQGGYDMFEKYVITLKSGVQFADYDKVNKVAFTITNDTLSNVEFKGDTLILKSDLVRKAPDKETTYWDAEGTEHGQIRIENTGKFDIEEGQVFIIDDGKLQQAYKAAQVQVIGGSEFLINYVKPELSEIYSNFTYSGSQELSEDRADEVEIADLEQVAKQLESSPTAEKLMNIFGDKPTFNVDAKLVGNEVVATITIKINKVVYTKNSKADLVFVVENRLGVKAESNIDNSDIMVEIKDVLLKQKDISFDVKAVITNKVTTKVGVAASGSVDKIDNIQQLIDNIQLEGLDKADNAEEIAQKLETLDDTTREDQVKVKIFKWTLPIADGAASISYDADLAFHFDFAGQFGVDASTTLKYNVGVSYNVKDGIEAYSEADEKNKICDELNIKLEGRANVKVGINQRISLDVLAGVLGVGLRANVGNFNRLYGYADAKYVAADEKNDKNNYDLVAKEGFKGTMYLEGGIYWDVNIDFAVKIGSLIDLNKGVNISTGEKVLYTGGSKEIIRDVIVAGVPAGQKVPLVSKVTTLEFNRVGYDIYDHANFDNRLADNNQIKVEKADDSQSYTLSQATNGGWVVEILNKHAQANFNLKVSYTYVDFAGQTQVEESVIAFEFMPSLVVDKDTYLYDKVKRDEVKMNVIVGDLNAAAPVVKVGDTVLENVTVVGNKVVDGVREYDLVLPSRALDCFESGEYPLVVESSTLSVTAALTIAKEVSFESGLEADGKYHIYCVDQVLSMLRNGGAAGREFILDSDIDMKGAVITPADTFVGTLNGNGFAIKNYKVNELVNKKAALIAENNGIIKDITFAGDVEVEIVASTNSDYYVAGVVAVNNGKMKDVAFAGNVSVKSTGLQAFVDFYVAGAVAVNNGELFENIVVKAQTTAENEVVPSVVAVSYKFDLANVRFHVGGAAMNQDADSSNTTITSHCEVGKTNNITKVIVGSNNK